MKKIIIVMVVLTLISDIANASAVDVMVGAGTVGGIVTSAVITKASVDNSNKTTNAIVRNLDAQTENIKKNGSFQIIRQPDGTAKVYQNGVEVISPYTNNPEVAELNLKVAKNFVDWTEKRKAKEQLKYIRAEAKIDKDKKTLALMKKYKNIDPRDLLQKIEESKKQEK